MNILVFSQFFPPEIGAAPKRILEHAQHWAQAGHKVTVVTNVPNSPFGKFYTGYRNSFYQEETIQGVTVQRIWTLTSGKKSSKWHRAFSFVIYVIMSTIAGLKEKRPDIVLASAPYLAGIPGVVASIFYKVPLIYEMRDPWIQVVAHNGALNQNGLAYRLLLVMEQKIIKHAKRVVVIGHEMARYLKDEMRLPDEPEVIYNGVSSDILDLGDKELKRLDLPEARDRFVIGCIGNMGNQYDFDVILEAAEELSCEPCFFLFLGEGAQKKRVLQQAKNRGITNIVFYPAVPFNEVISWIRCCDVTVVSMKPQQIFRVYLPLKSLDSLLLKVPVLFGGSGELEHILKACKGGAVFSPGDKKALVTLIKAGMYNREMLREEGESGSEFVCQHFTRNKMAKKYLNLIEDVLYEIN